MIRPRLLRASIPSRLPRAAQARRFLSTVPPSQKPYSWKSSAARWGIALAGIYYYNTSNVFAEEPAFDLTTKPSPDDDSTNLPTIEALTRERESRKARQRSTLASIAADGPLHPGHESRLDVAPSEGGVASAGTETDSGPLGSPGELEEEASQEGAFNPETGEINWDCPCLGGMAHGPCGEEFKAAFSCFVYSEEEPKGMDCIDRFKGMQDCFRLHPDVYGSELEDDLDDGELDGPSPAPASDSGSEKPPINPKADHPVPTPAPTPSPDTGSGETPKDAKVGPPPATTASIPSTAPPNKTPKSPISPPPASTEPHPPASEDHRVAKREKEQETKRTQAAKNEVARTGSSIDESEKLVPKAAHDAR